jgi:hypothetical protein
MTTTEPVALESLLDLLTSQDGTETMPLAIKGVLDFVASRKRWYPIYAIIITYLDAIDLLRLRRVCRSLSTVHKDALNVCWRINNHLKPFFDDLLAFQNVQAKMGALITVPSAHRFFDKPHLTGRVVGNTFMDVFVQTGSNADTVSTFIKSKGFTKDYSFAQHISHHLRILRV